MIFCPFFDYRIIKKSPVKHSGDDAKLTTLLERPRIITLGNRRIVTG
jgi:hypothetical protein